MRRGDRVLEVIIGIALVAVAATKLVVPAESEATVAYALPSSVGAIEFISGALSIVGRARVVSAYLTLGLGVAFCVWLMLGRFVDGLQVGCGCFGALKVSYALHAVIAMGVLFSGLWRVALLPANAGSAGTTT